MPPEPDATARDADDPIISSEVVEMTVERAPDGAFLVWTRLDTGEERIVRVRMRAYVRAWRSGAMAMAEFARTQGWRD